MWVILEKIDRVATHCTVLRYDAGRIEAARIVLIL